MESSPTSHFKSISSLALSFLYSPTLTSIHEHWKTIALKRQTFVGKVMFLLFNMLSQFSSVVTPGTAAHQASLSITNSQSLPKLISIESVMPSNHLILCCPLLFQPSIFLSIRVFSNESVLHIRWPSVGFQFQHQSFQ